MVLEILPYKETGTCIMKYGEEMAQMLDDHIVMTQAMSFSPNKKPFEGRITTLENKLRTTQVKDGERRKVGGRGGGGGNKGVGRRF